MNFSRLKTIFVHFLRAHHVNRFFRRFILLTPEAQPGLNRDVPKLLTDNLHLAAQQPPEELMAKLGTRPEGLSSSEAQSIRDRVGLNEVEYEKPLPAWRYLWLSYTNPFNLLLSVLALTSFLTGDLEAAITILVMVALSTTLRFWQERKAHREADALKAMVSNTATVLRRPAPSEEGPASEPLTLEIPINLLVPGDIITLAAGDMIPADCRVLTSKDLFLSQAALTGEFLPVDKFATVASLETKNILELDNILFMGTTVVSGTASALVVGTGQNSYFGVLAAKVMAQDQEVTSFQRGVNQVSWLLIRIMLVVAPIILLNTGLTKHDWLQATLFACSVAVGLTPEMLPMIVTTTLAKGAIFLSRRKVVVKWLDSIQNFGAMNVLCVDKTGTLTQNKIAISQHVDAWGNNSDEVLQKSWLNSFYQSGFKNLLDVAVLESARPEAAQQFIHSFKKIDEIPFDFQRRRMSVVMRDPSGQDVLICKGATEEILEVSTHVNRNGQREALTPQTLQEAQQTMTGMNQEGLRVVAVAAKETNLPSPTYSVADENGLTLIGYIAFLDSPKESATPALKSLTDLGVTLKILTGDNELVTHKICQEVGFQINQSDIVSGATIETQNDQELAAIVEKTQVFAKLTPAHKSRIVKALRSNGLTVGFMGDGINDAPALRAADIGISVDSAVDIAKEAADIILLEKDLLILEQGVREGRRTFCNMLKYIKMTISSNCGNIFSILIASVFLPFLPMLPLHLLIQNLLYDASQTAIPFDNVDKELIARPLRWDTKEILRFTVVFGPLSSIFDIATFLLMWYVFKANSVAHQALFQSGWFVVGLITQTLVIHLLRTPRIPFIQSRPAPLLLFMTLLIVGFGIFLSMGPLAPHFNLQALPPLYFLFLLLIIVCYSTLTQIIKGLYIKRYGWQ